MPKVRKTKKNHWLTKKQKGFCDDYLDSWNGTQSALKNYDTDNPRTAEAIGSENLSKPIIRAYLDDKGDIAGSIIEEIAMDEKNDKRVRLDASKFMYDHANGKATQKNEHTGKDGSKLFEKINITIGDK